MDRRARVHYVTIKPHPAEGLVEMEAYNTDTDGVSGQTVRVDEVWRWLWERRPCQVQVRGRTYWLEQPKAHLECLVSWL
ncbi:MAG: hypothetical protein ACK2VD_16295 [Anaerolineae bacterium]|jgi:hypothetical protein